MLKFIKNIPFNLSSDHPPSVESDEPDSPPVMLITVIIILTFVFLLFIGIILYTSLWKTRNSISNMMNTGMANETRMNYQKEQDKILSSYKKLENGLYQIPITQAMEIIIQRQDDD